MRQSQIDQLKQDATTGNFYNRLTSLDYSFWSGWKGILLLISFPIVVLSGWGAMVIHDDPGISWGNLGDAFAPIATFFTSLAFEAAVITLIQARKEIAESKEMYKLQKEELRLLQEEMSIKKDMGETAEEANQLAKERLELDRALQYMQIVQLYNTLKEAGQTELLGTLEKLMERYASKFGK